MPWPLVSENSTWTPILFPWDTDSNRKTFFFLAFSFFILLSAKKKSLLLGSVKTVSGQAKSTADDCDEI